MQRVRRIASALGKNGRILLREKDLPLEEARKISDICYKICVETGAGFGVNSHIPVASSLGCPVHLPLPLLRDTNGHLPAAIPPNRGIGPQRGRSAGSLPPWRRLSHRRAHFPYAVQSRACRARTPFFGAGCAGNPLAGIRHRRDYPGKRRRDFARRRRRFVRHVPLDDTPAGRGGYCPVCRFVEIKNFSFCGVDK